MMHLVRIHLSHGHLVMHVVNCHVMLVMIHVMMCAHVMMRWTLTLEACGCIPSAVAQG